MLKLAAVAVGLGVVGDDYGVMTQMTMRRSYGGFQTVFFVFQRVDV